MILRETEKADKMYTPAQVYLDINLKVKLMHSVEFNQQETKEEQ